MWGDCVSGLSPKSVSLDELDPECTWINGKGLGSFQDHPAS